MHSLPYFASSYMPPMFEVYEVYEHPEHEAHRALLKDLEDIPEEQVLYYVNESDIKHFFGRHKTTISRKLLIFSFLISKGIDVLRITHLLNRSTLPPLPYNHPELSALELDNNFLIKSSDFSIENGGICTPTTAFTLLPGTDAINSSYWLYSALFSIGRNDLIRIRLDPLIYAPVDSFNPMMYKMQVYGTVLNWNRIKVLRNMEHTQFLPEFPSSSDIERTDIVWKPVDDEIHFTCEEMPKSEKILVRGSRYFHAIFQRDSGLLKHCDGAIRFYTVEEYNTRLSRHIKANEVTRIGKRIKVFQIDVPKDQLLSQPITHQHFIDLVSSFYVWNQDVLNYFNSS